MNSLKISLVFTFLSFNLFAQNPYIMFTVSNSNYDYLGSSITNNLVFKTDKANLVYMIRPFGQQNSTQIVNFVELGNQFNSLNVFNQSSEFPHIDYGTTGSTAGLFGVTSESISKIAIKTSSGLQIKDTPPNPVFVFSNGKIFLWSKSQSKLYRSDDLGNTFVLIDSLKRFHPNIIYNPQGSSATISKSKNEKYILITGTSKGDGHYFSGIPENRADNLWIMYSTDYGNTWNGERVAADGYPNLIPNYHTNNFAPLFENYGQIDGAIDDSGYVYIAANGYGLVISGNPPYKPQFPMLFWNSKNRIWTSISDIKIDTLTAISNYYPGHLIGQACPSITVLKLWNFLYDVVICWTIPKLNPLPPYGLILSNGFYTTEIAYAYPTSLRISNEWNLGKISDRFPVNNGINAIIGPDYSGQDPALIPIVFMEDEINGSSILGQGAASLNPIKLTYLHFGFASNDDVNTELDFRLEQNYPNPFGKTTLSDNPVTKISWQSSVSGHNILKVYDILGREVTTLVNEYKDAGKYDVEFPNSEMWNYKDLSSNILPSGIYFYRLQVGNS
ncbi:MAG: hypothetical protein NZM09_03325, partial [Ignavibacterium sp.]|nr:hypothetical protein [Ignavibacterium sp.]MDW8374710.1 hypothetical protein [Ignavibacteriales bacterium]